MERFITADVAKAQSSKNLEVLVAAPLKELLTQVEEAIKVAITKGSSVATVKVPVGETDAPAIHECITLAIAKLREAGYYTYTGNEYPNQNNPVYSGEAVYYDGGFSNPSPTFGPRPLALILTVDWNNPTQHKNNNYAKINHSQRYW
jgi:hypothetical protein